MYSDQQDLILAIKVGGFLERLPLLSIMPKDDQGYLLTLDQIEQFACTGPQHLLILVNRQREQKGVIR